MNQPANQPAASEPTNTEKESASRRPVCVCDRCRARSLATSSSSSAKALSISSTSALSAPLRGERNYFVSAPAEVFPSDTDPPQQPRMVTPLHGTPA